MHVLKKSLTTISKISETFSEYFTYSHLVFLRILIYFIYLIFIIKKIIRHLKTFIYFNNKVFKYVYMYI